MYTIGTVPSVFFFLCHMRREDKNVRRENKYPAVPYYLCNQIELRLQIIMKKYPIILSAVLSCAITLPLLTACEKENDPVEPTPQEHPTDKGKWFLTPEMMDTTVRPGDDFYMYCLGGFWNKTEIDESKPDVYGPLHTGIPKLMQQRMETVTVPSIVKMRYDAAHMDSDAILRQKERLQSALDRIRAVTTLDEMWHLTGQLMAEGYRTPFELRLLSVKGRVGAFLLLDPDSDFLPANQVQKEEMLPDLINDPEALSCIRPLTSTGTRGFEQDRWPMLKAIFEAIGISPDDAYLIENNPEYEKSAIQVQTMFLLRTQSADLDTWKNSIMTSILAVDSILFSDAGLEAFNTALKASYSRDDLISNFSDKFLKYEISKSLTDVYITDDMKQRTHDFCEQLREAFRQRIAGNTWMSEASKQNALEKLNLMTFNIGSPDVWFEEGLPDLSRESTLLDDVLAVRRAQFNLNLHLVGMESQKASFHSLINNEHDLRTVNASYMLNFNSMDIYPVWLMEPLYDETANEAHNYAAFMTIGHEITHGFDYRGSQYNKLGDLEDIWASDADREEFKRRSQQLVECYNNLEVMPWALPGLCNDGAYTLNENIADLGGFLLAYDAYVSHLRRNGFSGDELDLQCRRLYMAEAFNVRAKYSSLFAMMYVKGLDENAKGKNVHSLFRERINGVCMNTDDWYRLFDIAETDKLYRKEEDRVRIW